MRRHDSLRTAFAWVDEQPVALIAPAAEFDSSLVVEDLAGEAHAGNDRAKALLLKKAAESRARSLDTLRLDTCTVVPGALLRLGADDHVLLLILHHIIVDGWSIGVFLRRSRSSTPLLPLADKRSCPSQSFSFPTSRAGSVGGARAMQRPGSSPIGTTTCARPRRISDERLTWRFSAKLARCPRAGSFAE